jgi:hypothetical protein
MGLDARGRNCRGFREGNNNFLRSVVLHMPDNDLQ